MIKKILLSPGHGKDTKGKRSPDGSLMEWEFNRKLVKRISEYLDELNIPYVVLDDEENDTPLATRVWRANVLGKNCLYISIHGNAAGMGDKWYGARGWCIYTSKGYTKSDLYAKYFIEEADKLIPLTGSKVRKYSQKQYEQDWEANFYVLKNTIMPAVLTENLFYDNKKDVEIMKTDEGIDLLARVHVKAIYRIIQDGL